MSAARSRLASRSMLGGSLLISLGMAGFAASTYAFTAFATRALGPVGFADFSVFWSLLYGVGLGMALPLEQETSRLTSGARTRGEPLSQAVVSASRAALVVLPIGSLIILGSSAVLVRSTEEWVALGPATAVAVVMLGVTYVVRGGLSGARHFKAYAAQLGFEGLARVAAAGCLAAFSIATPWAWAAAVTGSLLVAVALTVRPLATEMRKLARLPQVRPRPLAWRSVLRSMSALVVASVLAQTLVNVGPIAVRLLTTPAQAGLVGSFLAAALIARAPTLAFAALQAVLIPKLAETVERRDVAAYRRTVSQALVATCGLGVVGTAICAVAGPELLRWFSGPGFDLPRSDIVLLAVSTTLYLITLVLQPAAIAVRGHRAIAMVWVLAAGVFVGGCLLPLDPIRAVNLALVAAMAVPVVGLVPVINRGLSPARGTSGD